MDTHTYEKNSSYCEHCKEGGQPASINNNEIQTLYGSEVFESKARQDHAHKPCGQPIQAPYDEIDVYRQGQGEARKVHDEIGIGITTGGLVATLESKNSY